MAPRLKRKRFWVLGAVILAALFVMVTFRLEDLIPGCHFQVIREDVSPDGNFKAVERLGGCRAGGGVYRLELQKLGLFRSRRLIFAHGRDFDFRWKSPTELLVEGLPAPYVIERESQGITITYGDVEPL